MTNVMFLTSTFAISTNKMYLYPNYHRFYKTSFVAFRFVQYVQIMTHKLTALFVFIDILIYQ